MKIIKRTARPLSPRRELIRRIRHLSPEKVEIVLQTVRSLESDSKKTMADLENDIKTGAYKHWTMAEYNAWDPDYVKLTPKEEAELRKSEQQIAEGDVISLERLCEEEGLCR